MKEKIKNTKWLRRSLIILGWLIVWQLVSALIHNAILLCGPIEVVKSLYVNLQEADFWLTILRSLCRICGGFVLGVALGAVLAVAAFKMHVVSEILEFPIMALKSIPVASFVVLLLIWVGADRISLFIAMLLVFPATYVATLGGLHNTDKKLLEMAQVYRLSGIRKYRYIYKDAVLSELETSFKVTVGMSFKSGVAAEIIGLSRMTLGEKLYISKIQLDTAGLFAWTLVILALSYAFEKLVLFLATKYRTYYKAVKPNLKHSHGETETQSLHIYNVAKTFEDNSGLTPVTFSAEKGEPVLLMAPSGEGKTTLLHILAGLADPTEGNSNAEDLRPVSMTFQEDRLIEGLDAVSNISLTAPLAKEEVEVAVLDLIGPDALGKPVSKLSGGMKRRTALLRSLLTPSALLLLDEPFAGLDEENHKKAAEWILKKSEGRIVIVSTHDEADAVLLEGRIVRLGD